MFTFCFHVLSQLLLKKCSLSAAYMRAVCFHNTGTRQIQTQGTPFTADFCFVEGLQCYHHSVPELSTYSKKKKKTFMYLHITHLHSIVVFQGSFVMATAFIIVYLSMYTKTQNLNINL